MEVLEAILTRRSIRQFQDRPVPEDLIEKLLRAAMSAPNRRAFTGGVGRPQKTTGSGEPVVPSGA
jgi:nitroreductase